jgi:hypothetical protein
VIAPRRVKRGRRGRYRLELAEEERTILKELASELGAVLGTPAAASDDASLRRLFPPAYTNEPEAEREYQELMREDLLEGHRAALATLESTADATELDGDQLAGWLAALNDLRLVLGTRLDVREDEVIEVDPSDPDAAARMIYYYLGGLQEEVVDALAKG